MVGELADSTVTVDELENSIEKKRLSNKSLILEQLSSTEIKSYIFKYGEMDGFGTSEIKRPLRVNIIFQDGEFNKLEFLDRDNFVDLKNLSMSNLVIMDAIAEKIKELESLIKV